LFLGDRSTVLLGLVIEILDYLIFIDYEFFSKRIQDYGFVVRNSKKETIFCEKPKPKTLFKLFQIRNKSKLLVAKKWSPNWSSCDSN